jgi:hypothetical protein
MNKAANSGRRLEMQTGQNMFSKQINYLIKYYKANGNYDIYRDKKLVILDSIPQVLKDIGFRGDNLTLAVTKFFGILEKHTVYTLNKKRLGLPFQTVSAPIAYAYGMRYKSILILYTILN